MQKFKYAALDGKGKESQGEVEAENQTAAVAKIREKGLFPTNISEVSAKKQAKPEPQRPAPGMPRAPAAAKGGVLKMDLQMPAFLARVKVKQLTVFTRQLATLIDAGLPLLRGLQILRRQEKNPALQRAVQAMTESIESGSTFAEALAGHPRIFNKLFVNMVKAGEIGGVMDTVLLRLAEFMEKAQRIKTKVVGAMVYPVVVLVLAGLILVFLMTFIVPKFADVFKDLLGGKAMPTLTLVVMKVSQAMTKHMFAFTIGTVALIIILKMLVKTKSGKVGLDRLKLRMPIFGVLVQKTAISRFSRTLGTLMSSGVPVLQALNIVKETSGNEVVARAISVIHDSVKEGENMAPPLASTKVFPPMVVGMVEVGEETGKLPEMLMKIADSYDDDVDSTVQGLTSVIEPILIILLAVIVGTIVIALFLPLIDVIGTLGKSN
ncbi:MAG: type II secretion system F family protein [Kiritimatiellaeota bacterium]|nr:type II secretion system F family protein [Kiritimatiellota bacterium]